MKIAFGHNFTIANDIRQPLVTLSKTPTGKRYIHLATVRRGLKEYMAYLDEDRNSTWVEEVDPADPRLLKRIDDDNEWNDVVMFLHSKALLEVGIDLDHKTAKGYMFEK